MCVPGSQCVSEEKKAIFSNMYVMYVFIVTNPDPIRKIEALH